jgi:hypothetical protein
MRPPRGCQNAASSVPATLRIGAGILAVEAAGLAALGVIDLVKVVTGTPQSVAFAVVGALLALGTGAALLTLARAVRRVRAWAYTPVLVLQVLSLPVGYSLAVQAGLWYYGGPILVLGLTEIGLLLAPPSRRALVTPR